MLSAAGSSGTPVNGGGAPELGGGPGAGASLGGSGSLGGDPSNGGRLGAGGSASNAGSASSAGSPSNAGSSSLSHGDAGGADDADAPLGPVAYQQTFAALTPGLWKKNLDTSKIKAHPENTQVTASCGADASNCLRIVYRQTDGIHKQPPSATVFDGSGSAIDWTASDASHTNTATDVIQANVAIDGSTDGKSSASATPVPSKAYTLTYDMYFEPGFDFAKGGKLPGLAAAASRQRVHRGRQRQTSAFQLERARHVAREWPATALFLRSESPFR